MSSSENLVLDQLMIPWLIFFYSHHPSAGSILHRYCKDKFFPGHQWELKVKNNLLMYLKLQIYWKAHWRNFPQGPVPIFFFFAFFSGTRMRTIIFILNRYMKNTESISSKCNLIHYHLHSDAPSKSFFNCKERTTSVWFW